MKIKTTAILVITVLLLCLAPSTALAAEYTVTEGQTLDLTTGEVTLTSSGAHITTYTIRDGDWLSVAPGATATIKGSKNVLIDCGEGVQLTLDSVTIELDPSKRGWALRFTGAGNTLTLVGDSSLKSGFDDPGVGVGEGTALEIKGEGSLTAVGGWGGAGIGSGYYGDYNTSGEITISGGVVTATGGQYASGIGGAYLGKNGAINISGGIVYATRGAEAPYDIGSGEEGGAGGQVNISGTAAVLLGTYTIAPNPTTTTHMPYIITEETSEAYGIPIPAGWTPDFGGWLKLCRLDYDANDGSGTVPPSVTEKAAGAKVTVADGSGLSYGENIFEGWNTERDGSGEPYAPGDELTFAENTTLYAQWEMRYTLSYDSNEGRGTPPPSKTQDKDTETTVEENPFTKDECEFNGWNTERDGSGRTYLPGDVFTFKGDTILYAQWEDLYTLSYNANKAGGGSAPPPVTKRADSPDKVITVKSAAIFIMRDTNSPGGTRRRTAAERLTNRGAITL